MEGASDRESRPFDEGTAEAVLAPRKRPGFRIAAGRDRERQRSDVSLAHGRKRQAEVAPPEGGARHPPSRKARRSRARIGRSWRRAVKRAPSRGWIAARWSGVARENPTLGSGKNPAVGAAQAARPEVERSTGARVVSRLQRSERSIFSATSRGAARQTEVVRSSTERRRASTGRVRTLRAKGCEDYRANVKGIAGGFARSQDRDRTGGRHSGLMDGVVLNRKASCGVLATWGATTPDERREPKRRTRERRSRGSTHGATESVRGRDVRWGSPSRRAQGVSSQRERSSGSTPHAWVPWAGRLPRCARRQIVAEAATAKNRGIRRRERQRELFDPPHGNRRRTKMPRCAASSA